MVRSSCFCLYFQAVWSYGWYKTFPVVADSQFWQLSPLIEKWVLFRIHHTWNTMSLTLICSPQMCLTLINQCYYLYRWRLKYCDRIKSLLLCLPYSIINKGGGAAQVASFYCGLSLVHPQRVIRVNTACLAVRCSGKILDVSSCWLFVAGHSIPQLYYNGKTQAGSDCGTKHFDPVFPCYFCWSNVIMQLHMSALCSVSFYIFLFHKKNSLNLSPSISYWCRMKADESPAIKCNSVNCNERLSVL